MLCEHCGKNFAREGNLKRHKCKKNKKNEDMSNPFLDELSNDSLPEDCLEDGLEDSLPEENIMYHHSPVSSSSEEEKEQKPKSKVKRVTFKEKETTPASNNSSDLKTIMSFLTSIASKVDKLEARLNLIDNSFSTLENNIVSSSTDIVDKIYKLKNELACLFEQSSNQQVVVDVKKSPDEVVKKSPDDCCLIMATNEDRLKRRLFKICLVENWKEQQDKVKEMYHVIMEKTFTSQTDGYKMLGKIETDFSKRRVSPNKKWYKLRDDDVEGIIELFN
jgi:hypothetical protein